MKKMIACQLKRLQRFSVPPTDVLIHRKLDEVTDALFQHRDRCEESKLERKGAFRVHPDDEYKPMDPIHNAVMGARVMGLVDEVKREAEDRDRDPDPNLKRKNAGYF